MTTAHEVFLSAEALGRLLVGLFGATGMNQEDAAYCAEALVQTNLWGIDSHGVLRAPLYLERLRNGAVNPNPTVRATGGAGALELLDGDAGMGFVTGRAAMRRAVELARHFSVGAVGVANSNHFGAAGLYTRIAAAQGLIGIAMTNVGPNLVAPGGSRPITGNNPLAISIPTFADFPLTLDISLSSVAGGKLLLASKKGERIPLDWATDKEGRPTDDPDVAFAGFLLPLGGHKGLGLSYVVDILSGLITGGAVQFGIRSMYKRPTEPSLTGHFMIVINPLVLMSREAMQRRMAEFCQTIRTSPMWDAHQEMLLPGEVEYRTERLRRASGIPLPAELYGELAALARSLNVPMEVAGIPS
jgi:LDH2 family malate/lactate/ureidoglycolate dehydrogenase